MCKTIQFITVFVFSFFVSLQVKAQSIITSTIKNSTKFCFVENVGQYGQTVKEHTKFGTIKFGFEAFNMPVLITTNGVAFLQRKICPKKEREKDKKEDEVNYEAVDNIVTQLWVNSNPNVEIVPEELQTVYHTYGLYTQKAKTYRKLTVKNIYPFIDLVFQIVDTSKKGFEYSFIVKPGANVNNIKMEFGGDVKKVLKDESGNLLIYSKFDTLSQSLPITTYQTSKMDNYQNKLSTPTIKTDFIVNKNKVELQLPSSYDSSKTIVIDPFVTPLSGFTNTNGNIGYDIDYDYDGNIYVRGGGDGFVSELAKYSKAGVLQWVFNGSLSAISWTFGKNYGGWVVEKSTGNIYLGQGFNINGFRVIRLHATGVYDNFITVANTSFRENWKMQWLCNNGNPTILIAGGSTNSNLNFSFFNPPSTTLTPLNITGIPFAAQQDVSDFVIDPLDNSMYSIFCTAFNDDLNNSLYKHTAPYSASTIVWNKPSGYRVLDEGKNRPYLATATIGDNSNSINALSVNGDFLFYWDGKNLKAFNKSNGTTVGTPLSSISNTPLIQGGIVSDDCGNVFVGDVNGTIKVYKFNGSIFDDLAAPDILIPSFSASTTYALSYDFGKRLLYACGQGFVSSIDVATYCSSQIYDISINADCVTSSLTATLTPTPPVGSTITYSLYNGSTFISSNATGIFNSITPNTTYTIKSVINFTCSGVQFEKDFTLIAPLINTITTPSTCTQAIGTINVTGSLGVSPYTFSIDGVNFQTNNIFSGLAIGPYTITIKDAIGCKNTKMVTVPLSGINTVTLSPGSNATICEGDSTQINATSNANTFSWTPTSGLSNPNILNPKASPIVTTKYYITAKSTPCFKLDSLMVFVNPAPIANAGKEEFICNGKDAQLNGSGGTSYAWSPPTYLDNANIYNPKVIKPLSTITYSLQVTDNLNCKSLNKSTVKINVRPPAKVSLGNDITIGVNQATKLNAIDINNTGFTKYLWSPSRGLSSTSDKSPTAILDNDITYTVIASTPENCSDIATINIKVIKIAEIYVPNAFTPDGDGTNDVLYVLPIGLKELKYFAIYNSYGERIFYTTDPNKGWDGKIKGKLQNTSSFVWMVEGVAYRGNYLFRKGNVILIR